MLDSRTPELVVDFPYGGGGSFTYTGTGTYADPDADIESTTTSYAHSIADVVMSAARAGLDLEHLDEHVEIAFNPRGDDLLTRGDDGLYRILVGRGTNPGEPPQPMPVAFTFLARKV
jgi:hypothetical protein